MIDYEVRDNVAEIRFNNPPVNAIDDAFMTALVGALERAKNDNARKVVAPR